jgi:hypothetical protein
MTITATLDSIRRAMRAAQCMGCNPYDSHTQASYWYKRQAACRKAVQS